MRRDLLKMYFFTVIAESGLSLSDGATGILRKVYTCIKEDAPDIALEVVQVMTDQGLKSVAENMGAPEWLGKLAREGIGGVFTDVRKRGFRAVWEDLQKQYNRGAEANAANGTRGAKR